ncbi:MAG: hypothetical protein BJ554DRAFT_1004 [Olpidium bornovanus]|uniref:Spastin/Vps4 C-terminal domain-containing protein n=1 Tax=Olpidium bornovanus TaxID=278681 RepID=A0A8H8DHM0_9FUNG|nr:MAG: hypothetical protein BJ554DRAFT_1004 [Olpidium bornovanus]
MSMRRRIRGLTPNEIKALSKGLPNAFSFFAEELEFPMTKDDFDQALVKIQPSVSQADLKRFKAWMDEYGST